MSKESEISRDVDPNYNSDGSAGEQAKQVGSGVNGRDSVTKKNEGSTKPVKEAAAKGESLKLIAQIGDELSVSPQTIKQGDPLDVPNNLNAITMTLRNSGDVTIVGRGAGGIETATAVLRDLLDIWTVAPSPDRTDQQLL